MSVQRISYEPASGKLDAGYRHDSKKPIPIAFGGTGANSFSSAGLVASGNTSYAVTLTPTANTTLTLPTTGTLATLTDVPSAQTKKTITNNPVIIDTGVVTVALTGTVNQITNGNIEMYTADLAWASGGASLDTTQYGGVRISFNITISSSNNTFYYNGSSFTITAQRYSSTSLATALQNGLIAAGITGATVSYSQSTNKFTISALVAFSLPFASNTTNSIGSIIGFNTDHTSATSHVSDSAVYYIPTFSSSDVHPGTILSFTGITFTYPAAGTGKESTQLTCYYSPTANTLTLYGPATQGFLFAASGTIKVAWTIFRF